MPWGTFDRNKGDLIKSKWSWRIVMPLRNGSIRAHALVRLQLEAPIPDDANLLELEDQAANYIREAKRREPSENKELVSIVVDSVARNYFEHAIRKQQQRARHTHKP
jgi:hypothetical protein